MDRIRAFFTQKAGPLPVWAWAGIVLAGVLGYMYFTKTGLFGSGSSTAAGTLPTGTTGTGAADQTPTSGNGSSGLPTPTGTPSDTTGSSAAAGGSIPPGSSTSLGHGAPNFLPSAALMRWRAAHGYSYAGIHASAPPPGTTATHTAVAAAASQGAALYHPAN